MTEVWHASECVCLRGLVWEETGGRVSKARSQDFGFNPSTRRSYTKLQSFFFSGETETVYRKTSVRKMANPRLTEEHTCLSLKGKKWP